METADNQAERRTRPHLVIGRDELNLAEFPIGSLSRRVPDGCKTLVFEDRIRDQGTGDLVTRRLTVKADQQYGLPNWIDDDVIVGLIHLTKETNGFTDRTVEFSRYALIDLLGWHDTGQSFRRVDESLKRWLGVTLHYEKAWWDKAAQSWVDEHFHIIDNLSLYDQEAVRRSRRVSQTPLPFSQFSWNKVVFKSFQAENLKRLDLSLYFRLGLPAAKRAYRFLDKRFYRGRTLTFNFRDFACEHVGFSRSHTPAKLKEKFQPALEELEALGFLEPMSRAERYRFVGKEWTITLVKGGKGPTHEAEVVATPQNAAEIELTGRGVTLSTAVELVARHPADVIASQIEVFDWLIARKDRRVSRNPAGYLADSIRKGYATPTGFEPKADRERRLQMEKARRAEEHQAKRQREREADLERRITGRWDAMTPEEQACLEARALAESDEATRKKYEAEPPDLRRFYMIAIRRGYLQRLIEAEAASQMDGPSDRPGAP